jgi:hypothetical protein
MPNTTQRVARTPLTNGVVARVGQYLNIHFACPVHSVCKPTRRLQREANVRRIVEYKGSSVATKVQCLFIGDAGSYINPLQDDVTPAIRRMRGVSKTILERDVDEKWDASYLQCGHIKQRNCCLRTLPFQRGSC